MSEPKFTLLDYQIARLMLSWSNRHKNKFFTRHYLPKTSKLRNLLIREIHAQLTNTHVAPKLQWHDIDVEITICGIPASVAILGFYPGTPRSYYDEGDEDVIDYIVLDRKGYVADWLFNKMTQSEKLNLEIKLIEFYKSQYNV